MTDYNREELSDIFQGLAGLFLVFGLAIAILTLNGSVPAFALIGTAVGLSIIVGCWVGTRHAFFMVSMIVMSVILSLFFNFGALFS